MDAHHEPDHEVQGDHLSWAAIVQRISVGVAGAAIFGVGSMFIGMHTEVTEHETRIKFLETALVRLPDIDKNVTMLNGKVDVLNQKLDDRVPK